MTHHGSSTATNHRAEPRTEPEVSPALTETNAAANQKFVKNLSALLVLLLGLAGYSEKLSFGILSRDGGLIYDKSSL